MNDEEKLLKDAAKQAWDNMSPTKTIIAEQAREKPEPFDALVNAVDILRLRMPELEVIEVSMEYEVDDRTVVKRIVVKRK